MLDRRSLARMIDHTLLVPTATGTEVADLCREAVELGVGAVCVAPARLPLPPGLVPDALTVAAVVGFPSGAHTTAVKVAEAISAHAAGAGELDVVIDLGAATAGRWDLVRDEVAALRDALPEVGLKVIIEAAALVDDGIERACAAAEAGGADMVKTSTGFHPAGGATIEAVRRMRAAVGDRLGVKASGGIRTYAAASALVAAGASRLGCSATRSILAEAPEEIP